MEFQSDDFGISQSLHESLCRGQNRCARSSLPIAGRRWRMEAAIRTMMEEIASPITTIPGIGVRMGAMILTEIGDFSRFDSPDKILAYAGTPLSTYQSGQMQFPGVYSHMEKRGSRYLRYALYNAAKYVCL